MSEQATSAQSASAPQANTGAPNVQPTGDPPGVDPNLGKPKAKLGSPRQRAEMMRKAGEMVIANKAKALAAAAGPAAVATAQATGTPQGQEAVTGAQAGPASAPATGSAAKPAPGAQAGAEGEPKPRTAAEKADLAEQLARARRSAAENDRRRIAAEQRSKELEARARRADELERQEAEWKKDHRKAFQDLGMDLRPIVDGINKGEFAPPTAEQQRIAELERRDAEREKRYAEAEERAAKLDKDQKRSVRQSQLADELKAASEHFPALSLLPWAAQSILSAAGDDERADLGGIARQIEAATVGNFRAMLGSHALLKTALQDPALKKQVMEALGLDPKPAAHEQQLLNQPSQQASQRPSAGDGPRTITNVRSASTGDRGGRPSESQRRANLTEALRQKLAVGR